VHKGPEAYDNIWQKIRYGWAWVAAHYMSEFDYFVIGGEPSVAPGTTLVVRLVTLGGTGKETGERHPIIRSGVLLGAGAKILGRVEIGTGAKVGAGSVVLADVPPHKTVAGVPAVIVGESREENPAIEMNQKLDCRNSHGA
jgi:serine O-acetyltransferase